MKIEITHTDIQPLAISYKPAACLTSLVSCLTTPFSLLKSIILWSMVYGLWSPIQAQAQSAFLKPAPDMFEEYLQNRRNLLLFEILQFKKEVNRHQQKKYFLNNLSYLMQNHKARFNDTIIYVVISEQKMYLVSEDAILKSYPVSTSKKGTGMAENSFQTPLGFHRIKEKIGAGVTYATVFVDRLPIRKPTTIYTDNTDVEEDLITSRILWLDGLEETINKGNGKDSYGRYIYIHGTHEEGLIGKPVSNGCIRMKNNDIIELFDMIRTGAFVIITQNF